MRESLRIKRRAVKIGLENMICRSTLSYRAYLRLKYGARTPSGRPVAPWRNTTLKFRSEAEQALGEIKKLGLVAHADLTKNWDALSALATILEHTDQSSSVLDAGAETYSSLLPSLFLCGYNHLFGINLGFRKPIKRGPIRYEPGDITQTNFKPHTFDAISCLSVVEHGVDLASYFKEMSRILKPGGILITSTDYWPQAMDTSSMIAYGVPVKIFDAGEIQSALDLAQGYGLELTGPVDLAANERAVHWVRVGLQFTYVVFCLRKRE